MLARERHEQNGVRAGDAHAHDRAEQRGDRERGLGHEQAHHDAAERQRQRRQHHERVAPALVIDRHQQIDRDHRDREADAVHIRDLAQHRDAVGHRQIVLLILHDGFDVAADRAQVAILHAGEDVVFGLGVHMVHHGLLGLTTQLGDVVEEGDDIGLGHAARGRARGREHRSLDEQRRVADVGQ